jgi:UDP-GlcNAc:undecaprenyl-phosphate GlcNAc-1-phosphate transferase
MQMALLPCAATVGFLAYNLRLPGRLAARVFLGDAGSLSVGFLLAVYAVIICQNTSVPAITLVWAVALPLLDALTVIQKRSARGVNITQPGADHLHHLLRAWGLGPNAITALETLLAASFAGLGIALWQLGAEEWVSLFLLLILALMFRVGSDRAWQRLEEWSVVPGKTEHSLQSGHAADEDLVVLVGNQSVDPSGSIDSQSDLGNRKDR